MFAAAWVSLSKGQLSAVVGTREHGWHFLIRIFVSLILALSQPISVTSLHLHRFREGERRGGMRIHPNISMNTFSSIQGPRAH